MMAERLAEIRRDLDSEAYTSYLPKTVRELLDYIAQLEAQRGGAVVVAEPTPDEWREIAAKAVSADLVDFLSGAAAYGRWLRGKIPQAIPADRVLADGMVGVDREAIKTAIGLVRCLVVGPGSGKDALSAMESAIRSAKGETTP